MKPTIILAALTSLLSGGVPAAAAHPENWRAVADKLLRTPPETWVFNWGEGVQMIGVMKMHERTGDQRYADYVEQWAGFHLTKDVRELLNLPPTSRWGPGYCGHWSPATAILYLHLARKKAEHLRLAEQVADFIRSGAERAPDGGLGHWLGNHQLWVDTLYMACPLLSRLGMLLGRKDYIEDAANQIVVQARRLQDPKTGLFYHMWDWDQNTRSPDFWGRGNGWVLMSLADTMEAMGREQPSYKALKGIAEHSRRRGLGGQNVASYI